LKSISSFFNYNSELWSLSIVLRFWPNFLINFFLVVCVFF